MQISYSLFNEPIILLREWGFYFTLYTLYMLCTLAYI